MTERALRARRQTLGQFHHRRVRKARQHHVVERLQLRAQRRDDLRMIVTKQIRPPRTDAVQIAPSVKIVQPRPLPARNRHQRHGLRRIRAQMVLHLRARMPHGSQRALRPLLIQTGRKIGRHGFPSE